MKKTLLLLFAALMGGVNSVSATEDLYFGAGWEASLPGYTYTNGTTFKMSAWAEVGVKFDTPLILNEYKTIKVVFSKALTTDYKVFLKLYGNVSNGAGIKYFAAGSTTYECDLSSLTITDTQIEALTLCQSEATVYTVDKITLVKTDDSEVDYVAEPYTSWGVRNLLSAATVSFDAQYGLCDILTADGSYIAHATTDNIAYKYTITFSEATPTTLFFELDDSSNGGFGYKNIDAGVTSYSFDVIPSELSKDVAYIYLKSNADDGYPYTVKISSITREAFVPITFPSDKTLISYSPSYGIELDVTDVDGLTAYAVSSVTSTSVKLSETKGVYYSGHGYILEGTAGATYNIPVVESAPSDGTNLLSGTEDNTLSVEANSVYVLSNGKFCLFTGTEIPAHKAYLDASEVPDASANELTLNFGDDDATAIKNIKVGTEDNVYYDLQGRRVLYPTKGLYIVNGKKVIVK